MLRPLATALLLSLLFVQPVHAAPRSYTVAYQADLNPVTGLARVSIEVTQPSRLLRQLTFIAPPDRYRDFSVNGELEVNGDTVVWQLPRQGGVLSFNHVIDNRRASGGYDARITKDWALLKADKLIPPVAARAVRGARAAATLSFTGPKDWLFQTRYGRHRGPIAFDDPTRSFDRPTGWMVAGKIASRRDDIADRYVMVAGPSGQGLRHNDLLAFLSWNLPHLVDVLPGFPDRLLIVSAGGDAWRGGLSGAGSLYLHSDRPFISQNGTSTIIHELVHVGSRLSGRDGGDWIVEGIAEYYALEVLRRSKTISDRRHALALDHLRQWSESAPECIRTDRSKGPNTARAVLVLHEVDAEVRAATKDKSSLDDVMRAISARASPLSPASFESIVADVMGKRSTVLARVHACTPAMESLN